MANPASACDKKHSIHAGLNTDIDPPVRWSDRYDADQARFAIDTDNRKVVLLMTDRVVAMQLSDRVMHKIDRKLKDEDNEEENNALGRAIKTAVLSGVRSLLDHSAEVDIRDIARADYRDGEIVLVARNGRRLFKNTEVDDDDVMRAFPERDAKAFVRELRIRMGRERS